MADEYGIELRASLDESEDYDAVILAVAHKDFLNLDWNKIRKDTPVIFDVKSILDPEIVDGRL